MYFSLTDEHFHAFGRIAYGYASVEVGIKFCVVAMLDVQIDKGMTTVAPYSAYNLASVAKSLAVDYLKPEWSSQLAGLVNRWTRFTDIRTCVAHHRWRPGVRENSIRPTWIDVRSGKSEFKGFGDDEKDYTGAELFQIANQLHELNEDIKVFLEKSGLDAIIKRNSDADKYGQ